jgi:hypothetical protein
LGKSAWPICNVMGASDASGMGSISPAFTRCMHDCFSAYF